mgnify:CR=1 FL=1
MPHTALPIAAVARLKERRAIIRRGKNYKAPFPEGTELTAKLPQQNDYR